MSQMERRLGVTGRCPASTQGRDDSVPRGLGQHVTVNSSDPDGFATSSLSVSVSGSVLSAAVGRQKHTGVSTGASCSDAMR